MANFFNYSKLLFLTLFLLLNGMDAKAQDEDERMYEVIELSDAGKLKKAIKICDQVIAKNPNYLHSYINKSIILVELKQYEDAISSLDQGLKANPKSSLLYHERALLFQSYNLVDRALRDYELGIKFAESDSLKNSIKISQSTCKSQMRDFKGSYEILLECYAFDSTNMATLNNLAVVCDEVGKPEMTMVYLLKVIEADSLFVPGYVNIGFTLQSRGEYEKSIEYFDRALELNPNEALSYNNRGYSKLKVGDLEGALKDVNRSLELYPGNAYAYRNRALIYIEMDKISKACEDLQSALNWSFTEQYGKEVLDLQRKHCK